MMRTFRPLAALLAFSFVALATVAPVASAIPPPTEDCADIRPGVVACGFAQISFPSVGAGEGVATGIVTWKLTVYSQSGVGSSPEVDSAAVALAAVGASSTRDCAYAVLTADGVTVAISERLCWDL